MTWASGWALPGNRWDLLGDRAPSAAPMVTVVVSHYRQPRQLARTLEALRRQDHPRSHLEVIVADDGSPQAPHIPDGVRLVRQDDLGFRLAAARNLGVAAAGGDVLVFLDADTTPEPCFVRELVRLPALAPDCITVGHRRHARVSDVPPTEPIERAVVGRELADPDWLHAAYRSSRDLLDADDRSYRYVIGAVLACSRRLFDDIGGFDESFTSYGGEDWEWAYRAWIGGAMIAHVPRAVAWHDGPDAARRPGVLAAKNAEAIRLAGLIPVRGSRGYGIRSAKVDVAVSPPERATDSQAFISVDSVLRALPWADAVDERGNMGAGRWDRVRLLVEILSPLRVSGDWLIEGVARVEAAQLGELLMIDNRGVELIRISSMRARARSARWGRSDLFPTERLVVHGGTTIDENADVEGYLGGWA